MKQLITPTYTFTPAARTLDLGNISGFNIKNLYAVINIDKNQIIYAVGLPIYGLASLSGTVLTLVYDTSAMSATDRLGIIYDVKGQQTMSSSNPMVIASDQSNLPTVSKGNVVSTVNSTSTPLGANAVFTGTSEDVLDYGVIQVTVRSNVASATDGLRFLFSADNVTFYSSDEYTIGAGKFKTYSLAPVARYFKVEYTNGASAQSTFLIHTAYRQQYTKPSSHRVADSISEQDDAEVVQAVISARTPGGGHINIGTDSEGDLDVHVTNPTTAFGEVAVAEDTPSAQIDFVYGANSLVTKTVLTGSGTVTTANSLLSVNTTAATNSSALLHSTRYAKYRAGQGVKARYTAVFTTGASGSEQLAGMGDPAIVDGFFFGYDGANFGIIHYNNSVKTFIARTSFNYDVLDGTGSDSNPSGMLIDPTKGNVYQIKMQYLGFGAISFYVENPTSGEMTLVHEIKYANANTSTSVTNPAMNLIWKATNTTNATAITVKAASGGLFVEGNQKFLGPRYGTNNNKASITTQTSILTLRNATTYNGITNRAQMHLRIIGTAANVANASGIATLQVIKDATLGGTPSFTPISGSTANNGVTITSGQSVASVDTAGTTVTGGTTIYNSIIAVGSNENTDLNALDMFLNPGETMTFALTSTQSATVGVSVTWSEDT